MLFRSMTFFRLVLIFFFLLPCSLLVRAESLHEPSHFKESSNIDNKTRLEQILKRLQGRRGIREEAARKLAIVLPSMNKSNKSLAQATDNVPSDKMSSNDDAATKTRNQSLAKEHPSIDSLVMHGNSEIIAKTPTNTTFAKVLERMLASREARQREANRLGIILPSQGGEYPKIGQTLLKITNLLKSLYSRAPESGSVNFGFYPC